MELQTVEPGVPRIHEIGHEVEGLTIRRELGVGLPVAGFRQHLDGPVGWIDRDDLVVASRRDQLPVETPRQLLVLTLGGRTYRARLPGLQVQDLDLLLSLRLAHVGELAPSR